jgi:hypothetical protein
LHLVGCLYYLYDHFSTCGKESVSYPRRPDPSWEQTQPPIHLERQAVPFLEGVGGDETSEAF